MADKKNPFDGKTNAECIELLERGIERCKASNRKVNTNFQAELDVLINEIDQQIAGTPHFLALVKSFKNVAQQIEERELANREWARAQKENFLKMKRAADHSYRSNLEITILNRELTRRLRDSPIEYDPATVQSTSTASLPETSNPSPAINPVIDLSLSDSTENALLRSTSSNEVPSTSQEPVNSNVDSQPSASAEKCDVPEIPLPLIDSAASSVPTPPPLPLDEVSRETQEKFNLKSFSVVLEEKAEEIRVKRKSKRAASSPVSREDNKVRKTSSRKTACQNKPLVASKRPAIPKIKINVRSLTKVPATVTESVSDEFKTRKEFLEKFQIVPRETRHSERISSKLPRNKEDDVGSTSEIETVVVENEKKSENEPNTLNVEAYVQKIEDTVQNDDVQKPLCECEIENGIRDLERRLSNCITESITSDFLDIELFDVAASTETPQESAGSPTNPIKKRPIEVIDSVSSSLEKSPYREPPKRRHRSSSLGNLIDVAKVQDFRQLLAKESKEADVASTVSKPTQPRSILKKTTFVKQENEQSELDSTNQKPISDEKLRSAGVSKFEPLTITRQIGSDNEDTRSVVASTSCVDVSQPIVKRPFDGGRIPKKSSSTVTVPTQPPRPPRLPLRSDPGWYVASSRPQRRCYILEEHELPPAELGTVRNHVYVRLNNQDPDSLVHVTIRKKNGRLANFIAESTQGWPGVPHLPFDLTRQITPTVISSGFVYGRGLAREKLIGMPGYKKWEQIVFDPYLNYSFCCITMLDLQETKVVAVDEERFKISWMRNGHLPVYTHEIAEITLESDSQFNRADFTFQIHLVDMKKSPHFGINRMVLGEDFLERYLVCADASYERGRLYFENRAKPPRFYKTTCNPKREERLSRK